VTGIVKESGDFSNASLAYTTGNQAYYFNTRCRTVGFGYDVIADESHARNNRAFYPKQRALTPFYLTLELKGYADYKNFMDFMRSYMKAFTVATTHSMAVSIPQYNFSRFGIPIDGVTDGDHVGSMVFAPTITFQAIYDPLDTEIFSTATDASLFSANGSTADSAATFFYPSSANVNDPNATGESLYDASPIDLSSSFFGTTREKPL
jgi:hypothetical protein